MDEATHHQLAMRGGGALEVALSGEAAGMRRAAEELRSFHRRSRTERLSRPRRPASARVGLASPFAPSSPAPSKMLMAWVQWTGGAAIAADVGTASYEQHVDAKPGEVLLVPFETAQALLALPGSKWAATSVIPDSVLPYVTHDGPTGLDRVLAASTACWGYDGANAYFDPDNGAAAGEDFRMLVIGGVPYLSDD